MNDKRRVNTRALIQLTVLCVVLGAVMGVVWWVIAPTPTFLVTNGMLLYKKNLPGEYVAMDGWFAVLGAVAGALVAIIVLLRRRGVTIATVLAVSALGLLGSAVAWAVGRVLGPSAPSPYSSEPLNTVIHGQLTLSAHGVLFAWPVVSLAVLTFALAWESPGRGEVHAGEPAPDAEPLTPEAESASVGGDGDLRDLDRG